MGKEILLVGSQQDLYQQFLPPEISIQIADSFQQCREVIKGSLPDVIVVDDSKLGEEAVAACKMFKKYPVTQRVPLLFLASQTSSQSLLELLYLPIEDYLFLPANEKQLQQRLEILFELKDYKERTRLLSLKEKIAELEELIQIFPRYTAAYQELAEVYQKTNPSKAFDTLWQLAKLYHKQKNFGLATETVEKIHKLFTKHPKLVGKPEVKEALEQYSHMLQEDSQPDTCLKNALQECHALLA